MRFVSVHTLCLIFIFTFSPLLFSCSNENRENNEKDNVIIIDLLSLKQKQRYTITNEEMSFIKLETNEKCLLGDIKKIKIADSLLFISDTNNKLFVFDFSGRFLNEIGFIGQGPDGLLNLSNFYVDTESKRVGIYDVLKQQVFQYDYEGNLMQKTITKDSFSSGINKLYCISKNKFMASMSLWKIAKASKYNFELYAIEEDSCSLLKSYCPFGFKPNENISLLWSQVAVNTNGVFFTPLFSNIIYSLNKKGEKTKEYVFKGDAKSVDNYPDKNDFKNYHEGVKIMEGRGYDRGISDLYATETHILFHYTSRKSNKYYTILWDMKNKEGVYTDFPELPYPINRAHGIYTTYDTKFVTALTADEVIAFQKGKYTEYGIKGHKQLDEITEILTAEDNPIIVLYELK